MAFYDHVSHLGVTGCSYRVVTYDGSTSDARPNRDIDEAGQSSSGSPNTLTQCRPIHVGVNCGRDTKSISHPIENRIATPAGFWSVHQTSEVLVAVTQLNWTERCDSNRVEGESTQVFDCRPDRRLRVGCCDAEGYLKVTR